MLEETQQPSLGDQQKRVIEWASMRMRKRNRNDKIKRVHIARGEKEEEEI